MNIYTNSKPTLISHNVNKIYDKMIEEIHNQNRSIITSIYDNFIYPNLTLITIVTLLGIFLYWRYSNNKRENFNNREKIRLDFRYSDFLKQFITKNKIYSYESNSRNIFYWKNFGMDGLLVEIKKLQEFKKNDL